MNSITSRKHSNYKEESKIDTQFYTLNNGKLTVLAERQNSYLIAIEQTPELNRA